MPIPKIKICCISSSWEAQVAIRYGASCLGLVGKMPSGPGVISDELIREIAAHIPPSIGTFLLTSETDAEQIVQHQKRVGTTTVQMVDELKTGNYHEIRAALPGIRLVQVVHVLNESSIEEALRLSGMVDALLLDSGNPNARIKTLGGTGNTHDWTLSRRIREQSSIPVFLAGGLNPANVARAIQEVNPYGLDLCSGVRTGGKLDESKLDAFFRAVRGTELLHGY